jgi:hypothetical protein
MLNVKVDNLRGVTAPLYHRHQNQNNPQPAYIEINENGGVKAGYSEEIGDAVPEAVKTHAQNASNDF